MWHECFKGALTFKYQTITTLNTSAALTRTDEYYSPKGSILVLQNCGVTTIWCIYKKCIVFRRKNKMSDKKFMGINGCCRIRGATTHMESGVNLL